MLCDLFGNQPTKDDCEVKSMERKQAVEKRDTSLSLGKKVLAAADQPPHVIRV